jgi:acyl homoserine lactone synthase
MHNVTFDMSTMHMHGDCFYDFLRLRKRFFVDALDWGIPHNADVEMDQYDNPSAHYSVVVENERVIGGARTTPTSAVWGEHTCMLEDAIAGRLGDIPPSLLGHNFADAAVWECTRLVISDSVDTSERRTKCLALIVDGLVRLAQDNGATDLVSISPLPLMRALRHLGHKAHRIGEPYKNDGDGRTYAVLSMPATRGHIAEPATEPEFAVAS